MKNLKYLLAAYLMALPLMSWGLTGLAKFSDPYLVKEFSAAGVKQLDIQSAGSSIEVSSWAENKIYVEVFVRQNGKVVDHDDAAIQDKLKHYEVEATQTNGRVFVSIKSDKSNWKDWKNNIQFSIEVKVPAEMSTSFQSSGGSIALSGLKGEHEIRSSGGSLKINNCAGSLAARSSGGSFSANSFSGDLTLESSGGSVKMDAIDGSLQINSSGGSINLNEINGKVVASSSGGTIKVSMVSMEEELSLKASGGSISVSLPQDQGMSLDVSGGSVSSQLAFFEGVKTNGSMKGTVKGGGVAVTLATSGGSVRVEGR